MEKTVLIFVGMLIVGMPVLVGAADEVGSPSVEKRLSSIEQWLSVTGITTSTHAVQIEEIYYEAYKLSKRVYNLEKKMCDAEEGNHQRDLAVCSLLTKKEQFLDEKDECPDGSQFILSEGTITVISLLSKCNQELVVQVAAQQNTINQLKNYITCLDKERIAEGYGASGSDDDDERPPSPSPLSLPSPYIDPNLLNGSSSPRSHID